MELFENPENSKALSDKKEIERSLYTTWKISEGFVVIFYELVEKNETLKHVLLNVIDATNEYKNNICKDWYNLDYNKLSFEDKSYIDSFFMTCNRIHLMEYSTDYLEYIRKNKQ